MSMKTKHSSTKPNNESNEEPKIRDHYYQEIQVELPSEKPIYELFFDREGRFIEDQDTDLYLYVFGLVDYQKYEKDGLNILPKWYICSNKTMSDSDFSIADNSLMVELKFIEDMGTGIQINFVGREGSNTIEVITFVNNFISKLNKVAHVNIIKPNDHLYTINPAVPWEQIPEHNFDRRILKLWYEGYTYKTIGEILHLEEETVKNRNCLLRKKYTPKIVPYNNERKRTEYYKSRDLI